MSNEIQINVPERVVYNDDVVLMSKQLAEFYECEFQQIRQNFANNRNRFVEGKHYYRIEGEELKNLRVENFYLQISPKTRVLYLWTKQGTARHAKMLGTDKAWEVFTFLEENYFNPKSQISKTESIKSIISDPDLLVELAVAYRNEVNKNKQLTKENEIMQPKAKYYDEVLNSASLITITSIAKQYGLSGQTLNRLLYAWGIQYDQGDIWVLYQDYADKGYAFYEEFPYTDSDGIQQTHQLLKWTQKGKEFLHEILTSHGYKQKRSDKQCAIV